MGKGEHLGPALSAVSLADDEGIAALRQEQRARLQVVREHALWDWFGGMPSGFGQPTAPLRSLYLNFAFLGLLAVAMIVAGFTHGPVLWVVAALAIGCLVAAKLTIGPPTRQTQAFYRNAVQVPAVAVAWEPEATDPDNEMLRGVWALVAFEARDAAAIQRLIEAGDRLRALLAEPASAPADLQPFVADLRGDVDARRADGSRVAVPATLGKGLELARLRVSPNLLPGGSLTSRLLFVFADPECREPAHSRVLQSSLWGAGVDTLCAELPLGGAR